MLIEGERIAWVGKTDDLPDHHGSEIDARGKVVMPGFVDAHTHAVFAGSRVDDFERRCLGLSYQQIAAEGGGIRSTVRQTRAATEDQLFAQARRHAKWFVRGGTTTIEVKSGYGLTTEDELKILRVAKRLGEDGRIRVVPTFLGLHAVPSEFDGRKADYVDLVLREILPKVAQDGLAEYADAFIETGYFDADDARALARDAKQHGLKLRLHVDQFTNSGGARLAAELGAATADHLERADAEGIAAMKRIGVQPVILPASVYGLGLTHYPPARQMIDAGLAIVLATDFNPGSSPTPSMPMAISLACTQMKLTPAESISAATINAAYSLGRGGQIGSLEPGKLADFAIFDTNDYREIAIWFGVELAQATYVGGRNVFERA